MIKHTHRKTVIKHDCLVKKYQECKMQSIALVFVHD